MNNRYPPSMNILEFFIGVGLAITLIAFFSFKAQSNLLEAVESSHVAHSASLVHIRNYIHLLDSEDHAQISKILTQIEKLTVALNDLSEASNDITVRFPHFFWLGDSLSHMLEDYTKTARGQLALLEKTIEAKQQTENKLSLQKLERIVFSDSMDEVAEQTHERLMSSIFLTSKAAVYSLILTTALTFSVIVLYLSHYITELKKTKLALQAAVKKAEESNHAKSMFLATMSHEIRTPMNGVIGMTQLLISDNKDPKIREHLTTLLESGEHLMVIINEILDFSKLEQGKLDLSEEEFDINQLLIPIMNAFKPQANDKSIQLVFDTKELPNNLVLKGDIVRLRQIVFNLVGNAIKFTSDGMVKAVLKYDIKTERLSFQVSDTGIGIPTARLESIFNPFEQAEVRTMHDFGGTGLGLSIVKKLCLAMGGNVTVTSELGIGSCFTATVIAPVGMRSNIQKAPQLQESFEGETVLIVEDNRVNQLVAKRMCQKLGFTVCIASNGEEALKKVQKAPFNVVLMDHQMPKMGGIEATCIIRNEHDFKGTILGCTADVTDETAAGYMRAGANGVITKPIRLESLAEAITQSRESKSSYVIES